MTYIIHGATGAQGAPIAAALTGAGKSITAAVRNPDTFSGGPAVAVDFANVDSLEAAYQGAEGLFVHLPIGSPDQQLTYAGAIVEAVKRAQPSRVVFSTSGFVLGDGDTTPHDVLFRGLQESGTNLVTVAPRLYLENLLLPPVTTAVRERGLLPYPIRSDYRVSWSSHLDVADVVAGLFVNVAVSGVVDVGALPGLIGADLAAGFERHFGREVGFESHTPEDFGAMLMPLFGEDGIRPVVEAYRWRWGQEDELGHEARSAQVLLGMKPRSVEQWLRDVGA